VTVLPSHLEPGLDERLAMRTLELVNVASVSGDETTILGSIAAALPEGFDVADRDEAVVFAIPSARRAGAPSVVLAGTSTPSRPTGTSRGRVNAIRSLAEVPPT
jgi:hypothetical protein